MVKLPRPPTSMKAKRESYALAKGVCGCGCGQPLPPFGTPYGIIYDHRPPLANRPRSRNGTYTPAANDPAYLRPLLPACDKRITFGPGGEKRITTRGSDIGEMARTKTMRDKHNAHTEAMRDKKPGKKRKPKGTIKSRGFSKQKRGFR